MTLASNLPYLPLNPVKLSLHDKSLSLVHDIFFLFCIPQSLSKAICVAVHLTLPTGGWWAHQRMHNDYPCPHDLSVSSSSSRRSRITRSLQNYAWLLTGPVLGRSLQQLWHHDCKGCVMPYTFQSSSPYIPVLAFLLALGHSVLWVLEEIE